jgi:hypothetical protein
VDELRSTDSEGSLDADEWEEEENTDDREFIVDDSDVSDTPLSDDSDDED